MACPAVRCVATMRESELLSLHLLPSRRRSRSLHQIRIDSRLHRQVTDVYRQTRGPGERLQSRAARLPPLPVNPAHRLNDRASPTRHHQERAFARRRKHNRATRPPAQPARPIGGPGYRHEPFRGRSRRQARRQSCLSGLRKCNLYVCNAALPFSQYDLDGGRVQPRSEGPRTFRYRNSFPPFPLSTLAKG